MFFLLLLINTIQNKCGTCTFRRILKSRILETNRNKSYRRLSDEQNMMNLDESFTFCSSDQHHSEQMRYSTCTPLGIKTEILPMQRKQDETRTKQKDGNTSGWVKNQNRPRAIACAKTQDIRCSYLPYLNESFEWRVVTRVVKVQHPSSSVSTTIGKLRRKSL